MNREQILAAVKRTTEANGNVPLGERTFYAETRLTRRLLWSAGFANYGSAVEAAGYQRNKLTQAYSDDQLFNPLAKLARKIGRFPSEGEREVARHKDSIFPGVAAYRRRGTVEPLAQALLNWCRGNEQFKDVAQILETSVVKTMGSVAPRGGRKIVTGYVYLMRYGTHGRDFKLGWSENVARRESQLDMVSPSDVRLVHCIETDDPKGIEEYWFKRFAERRVKTKEVFRLTPDDVAAFKRRKYQ